jgi:hypothetical protein
MLASVRSWGWWAERFRDNTFGVGARTASHQSPPDMIAIDPEPIPGVHALWGRPFLMELKAVRHTDLEKASIPLKRCEGHQLERLLDFPGPSFVVVMFYEGERALKRSAVMIPSQAWAGAVETYGRLSVPLSSLREDLPASSHLRWVGRSAAIGPWVRCTSLGSHPTKDT